MSEGKVNCRTPNKPGAEVNIPHWKYVVMERAVRDCLQAQQDESMGFMAMIRAVEDFVPSDSKAELGSIGWHATTVVLEMEVRGQVSAKKIKGTKTLSLT